jgi:(p)ppGpp synthase/HD superfamily hydrolase
MTASERASGGCDPPTGSERPGDLQRRLRAVSDLGDDDLVARAADLAREVHKGDYRKGTEIPYFEGHLAPVALLVEESGGTDVQIAAAYLHDAAEDEGGQAMLDQIREEMGDEVAQIVEDLSDSLVDTSITEKEEWEVRKPRYVAHLALAQRASLEVSLADKVHNAQSILDDYQVHGEELWDRFNKPAEYQLWYYRKLAGLFTLRLTAHPLTPVLDDTVAELTALVRETIPDIDTRVIHVSGELGRALG